MATLAWRIGALVEIVLAFLGLLVVLIITLVTVHRRGDPLRKPFLWLKISIVIFFLFLILSAAIAILRVLERTLDWFGAGEVLDHLYNVDGFLASVSDVFTLLCLVELALSCLLALGKDGIYRSIIRYCNLIILLILFALAVAALGTGETSLVQEEASYDDSYDDGYDSYKTSIKLLGAFAVIYWIVSLVVLSLSGCILYLAVRRKNLQKVASLFLVASIFNLARTTYDFVYSVLYYFDYNIYTVIPVYLIIVDPILYTWLTVIVLGILMGMGYKKLNGLWSQQPPLQQPPLQQGYGINYGGGPPLQQGYGVNYGGGNTFYGGQELPAASSPAYYPQQQRHPSELIGSAGPTHRAELGYPSPHQQYYVPQNLQQQPFAQNQMQYVGSVPTPTHYPIQQGNVELPNAAPGVSSGENIVAHSPTEQPQLKQPSEIGVTSDQKR